MEKLRSFADAIVQVDGDGTGRHQAAFLRVFEKMKEQSQNVLVRNGEYKLVYTFRGDAAPSNVSVVGVPEYDGLLHSERRPHRHDRIARARAPRAPGRRGDVGGDGRQGNRESESKKADSTRTDSYHFRVGGRGAGALER